jgi:hypothetical protein
MADADIRKAFIIAVSSNELEVNEDAPSHPFRAQCEARIVQPRLHNALQFSQYSLGICEKAAENGILSTTPQTREPRRFKLV